MLSQTETPPAAARNPPNDAAVGRPAALVSAEEFREALSRVASSVSIVTTDGAHGIAGFTCSAVCAVTDEPPTILVCVNRKSAANAIIKANGVLCVSSLGADQVALSQMFAGVGRIPMQERFGGSHWGSLATGSPYCKASRVALDCRIAEVRELGTHSIFFAEVLSTAHAAEKEPLLYCSRSYATIQNVA
jgi:flavin reductase (NADH)/flavin reductase/chlorophenol-4-monooxygenase component 1